ncbi:hypothetical protein BT96DRAFT_1002786 [Gymnopus androsaceus JB14]|uniref:Uncharacterized protein n=1 Tax=Gymnopus androsaceus JB14 TaxID=1447944 RepID=A0A6A4GWV4_9AGAR|nr:hypothetical protein BT96DRAFT_1002786 [Gymnopus androsaceus JB14]
MSLGDIPTTDTIICTVGICSSFKEKPIETITLWNIQVPSSSITQLGESSWCISISQLLSLTISQLLVEYICDVSRFDGISRCFQNAKHICIATLRVPDFTQNVNLEILGFRAFSGTLEDALAHIPQSYLTTVFSSDGENHITQSFLSNSPKVLMGAVNRNNHAHFIILLEDMAILTSPIGPVDFPPELWPAQYFIPEISAESSLSSSFRAPSPSPSPDLTHLETYQEYLFHMFQQGIESAVYSREGGTQRKLWFSIQNHRKACEFLTQAGFKNFLTTNEEFFELPSGTRLSMSHILTSELEWDVLTFRRKSRYYGLCAEYTASHHWNGNLFPPLAPPPLKGTHNWREWNERNNLLGVWKKITAMFGPEGYASFAKPPVASSHIKETLAAKLTEGSLPKISTIKEYLVPRALGDDIDGWF